MPSSSSTTRGAWSRYFSGTCPSNMSRGSQMWSSTLTRISSSGLITVPPRRSPSPRRGAEITFLPVGKEPTVRSVRRPPGAERVRSRTMTNVMQGIRILEVAEHTFVPAASGVLADWGAEVIKIEHVTRGDAARGLGSTGIAGFDGKVAVLMEHANRGKKSLGLDLTDPAGRDLLYRLAAISDVFLTNKMAGVRKKLQIEVDDIRAHNPNIVYVRGTGYGNRGPDTDAGGYDSLGFWARGTVAYAVTPSDLPQPVNQPGPAFGDSIGAMTIAGGISAALLHRERTGEATVVDISLLSTAMWAMGGTIAVSQDIKMPWQAPPAGEPAAPFNPLIGYFGTSDGRFIMFSMLQGFHYWPEVCERLDRKDLIGDPRFDSNEHIMANAAVGAELIRGEIAKYTLEEIKAKLTGM